MSEYRSIFGYGKTTNENMTVLAESWKHVWQHIIKTKDTDGWNRISALINIVDDDLYVTRIADWFWDLSPHDKKWAIKQLDSRLTAPSKLACVGSNALIHDIRNNLYELYQYWWLEKIQQLLDTGSDTHDITKITQPEQFMHYTCEKILNHSKRDRLIQHESVLETLLHSHKDKNQLREHFPMRNWFHHPYMSRVRTSMIHNLGMNLEEHPFMQMYDPFMVISGIILSEDIQAFQLESLFKYIRLNYSTTHPIHVAAQQLNVFLETQTIRCAEIGYFQTHFPSHPQMHMLKDMGIPKQTVWQMLVDGTLQWDMQHQAWRTTRIDAATPLELHDGITEITQ